MPSEKKPEDATLVEQSVSPKQPRTLLKIEPTESPTPTKQPDEKKGEHVRKKVGRIDSFSCYEVTEDELTMIEQGSPDSVMLNLAIFFAALASSILLSFFTAKYENETAKTVCLIITVVAFAAAFVLAVLWRVFRRSRDATFKKIRDRGTD
jgi:hypothetical protein